MGGSYQAAYCVHEPFILSHGRRIWAFSAQISECKCVFEADKLLQGIRTWNWKLAGQPVSNSRCEFGGQLRAQTGGSAAKDELWTRRVARSYHQI